MTEHSVNRFLPVLFDDDGANFFEMEAAAGGGGGEGKRQMGNPERRREQYFTHLLEREALYGINGQKVSVCIAH